LKSHESAEFTYDLVVVSFGLLDIALFVYVFYSLGPPWFNRSSIVESIMCIISFVLGGGGDVTDFVSLGVVILIAIDIVISTAIILGWIKRRQAFAVDWDYLVSRSKYLGVGDAPFLVVYASQVALVASVLVGSFVRSSLICYVAMVIFMSSSWLAFSLEL